MLELVKDQFSVVVNKIPIQLERRRWNRGIELDRVNRKTNRLPPLPEGRFKLPWGLSEYELLPVPKVVPQPVPKAAPQPTRKPVSRKRK